ncbi:hypothetical protein ACS0TY_036898 [Phlomoides rotata]
MLLNLKPLFCGIRSLPVQEDPMQEESPWIYTHPHGGLCVHVNWDDPQSAQYVNRVSPWPVESITLIPPIDSDYHPSKKLRAQDLRMLLPIEVRDYFLAMELPPQGLQDNQALEQSCSSTSIQRARQDRECKTSLCSAKRCICTQGFNFVVCSSLNLNKLGNCVEIGLPMLLLVVALSQYYKHIGPVKNIHIFKSFQGVFSIVIIWLYTVILTTGGANNNRPLETRTRSGNIITTTPWFMFLYSTH